MYKILLIEDEHKVHHIIKQYFIKENYTIFIADTGKRGLELFHEKQPDLIILDLMLPDYTGEYICKHIREKSNCPIIMLTAKSSESDRINGFELGADDYLIKPFSPKELILRVNAVLKRVYKIDGPNHTKSYENGRIIFQLKTMILLVDNQPVNLTPIEQNLLELFVKHPHQVFSREQLIEHAMGLDFDGYDRTIDAHIKNLRKKIEHLPKSPKLIATVFALGYRWEGENDA